MAFKIKRTASDITGIFSSYKAAATISNTALAPRTSTPPVFGLGTPTSRKGKLRMLTKELLLESTNETDRPHTTDHKARKGPTPFGSPQVMVYIDRIGLQSVVEEKLTSPLRKCIGKDLPRISYVVLLNLSEICFKTDLPTLNLIYGLNTPSTSRTDCIPIPAI